MARVHTDFVGCKVSQADSRDAAVALAAAGHRVVDDPLDADLCVVVTCGVTGEAERKSRRLVRRAARSGRPVVVAGCAVPLRREQFEGPGVYVAGGGDAQGALAAAVEAALTLLGEADGRSTGHSSGRTDVPAPARSGGGDGGASGASCAAPLSPASPRDSRGRTRFTLKVQDGCPVACTYCAVRLARGRPWSLPLAAAAAAVAEAAGAGCGEVVLTGVNLGRYAADGGRHDLAALVARLCDTPGLARLRLSSIEPLDLTPRLLDALAHPRLARHLHVPLQSGDDAVLAAMGRPYGAGQYRDVVARARRALGDDLAVTTDVIVGFPTEDEAAFAGTLSALEPPDGLFSRVHVFRYSPRPGTAAAALGRLPGDVVAVRMERALSAAAAARAAAASAWIGRPAEVLVEERRGGLWRGYSSQYVRYYLSGDAVPGALVTVVADKLHGDGLKGRIE